MQEEKMEKRRINLLIEEELYQRLRAAAFLRRKSMSQLIREAIRNILTGEEEQVLSARDEQRLLEILKNDEFLTEEEAKKELELE